MEKLLFGIPIFEDEVDLEKIILPDVALEKHGILVYNFWHTDSRGYSKRNMEISFSGC